MMAVIKNYLKNLKSLCTELEFELDCKEKGTSTVLVQSINC